MNPRTNRANTKQGQKNAFIQCDGREVSLIFVIVGEQLFWNQQLSTYTETCQKTVIFPEGQTTGPKREVIDNFANVRDDLVKEKK